MQINGVARHRVIKRIAALIFPSLPTAVPGLPWGQAPGGTRHDHEIRQPVRRPRRSGQRRLRRHADQRPPLSPTSTWPPRSTRPQAMAKLMDRPRLQRLLDGRAPFPARRHRVHPQRADDGAAPRARDQEHQDRLRLQHRADVASAAAGRGLRHGRHPHRRPRHLRRRAAAITRARSRRSARRCSTRRPTASCSRSRSTSSSRRSTTSRSRTRASTTRCRPRCRIAATR